MALSDRDPLKRDVIVIGTSMGGVEALRQLCAALPEDFPGIIGVVLHRSPHYAFDVVSMYASPGKIRVREPQHREPLERGMLYLAPRDQHMLFYADRIALSHGPKEHFTRPAVDPLFLSAADTFANRVVGVLLTGGGVDGVKGLLYIKARQGFSIVQDPAEASSPSMPLHGLRNDHVDVVAPLAALPSLLESLASGDSVKAAFL